MRVRNALVNTIAGGLGTLLAGVLQFVSRIVFIRFLSDEYLGISSLFTNILSILSLAELGIGTAICYSLYRPLAEGDRETIKAIMRFFRRTYLLIGLVVFAIGLLLLPFLPYLMTGTTDLVDVRLVYLLYVLQSVFSYWFWAYKGILLQADQKLYLSKFYFVISNVTVTVLQLILLAVFRDFLLYSAVGLCAAVLTNLLTARTVDRQYPYLKEKTVRVLEKEEKRHILKDVLGMSLFKINTTVVNSTDNIVISALINVRTVALYGNYQTVISGISQVVMQFFAGVTASVGNLHTEDKEEKNEFVFRCLQLLCYWVYSLIGIGILVLVNPVIGFFFGEGRLFGQGLVFLQVLYFVINGFQRTSFIYRDACGLFWHGKWRPAATALLNIVISVVLVRYIGLAGVLWGTILSWLLTTWWYDPMMIYRRVFKKSAVTYFLRYLQAAVLTAALGALCLWLSLRIPVGGVFGFLLKGLIALMLPNLGYYLCYRKTEEFSSLKKMVADALRKLAVRQQA